MLAKFENRGYTLKMHKMFSVHTTPEEFKNATITSLFAKCCQKNRDYHNTIVFEKLHFQNIFIHKKTKSWSFQVPPA